MTKRSKMNQTSQHKDAFSGVLLLKHGRIVYLPSLAERICVHILWWVYTCMETIIWYQFCDLKWYTITVWPRMRKTKNQPLFQLSKGWKPHRELIKGYLFRAWSHTHTKSQLLSLVLVDWKGFERRVDFIEWKEKILKFLIGHCAFMQGFSSTVWSGEVEWEDFLIAFWQP